MITIMMIILISMCNQMVLSLSGTWLLRYSLYFVHYQVVSAPLPVPALHQMLAIFILKPRFWRENVLSVRNLENYNNNDIWRFFYPFEEILLFIPHEFEMFKRWHSVLIFLTIGSLLSSYLKRCFGEIN